jgi:CRISPR-associated protein Csy1
MTPLSYLLAAMRLAPVQCAAWGHPVTTGSDRIDYFLSCAAMEPGDAASHYTERLVGLPGLGVDYAMPPPAPASTDWRSALGLAQGAHVYVCPQSLFKIHPEMDSLFAQLLARDPQGVLLFFQAPAREVTLQFSDRLQRALRVNRIPALGQVKFVPRLDARDFRGVVAMADVVVDTMHWSGGNTSLDAIAAGTPIVAWPGRFMRGRQSAAMLDMMGLGQLVASSAEELIGLALDVASDRGRNTWLREQIRTQRGTLFERKEPIAALEQALLRAAAGERP